MSINHTTPENNFPSVYFCRRNSTQAKEHFRLFTKGHHEIVVSIKMGLDKNIKCIILELSKNIYQMQNSLLANKQFLHILHFRTQNEKIYKNSKHITINKNKV